MFRRMGARSWSSPHLQSSSKQTVAPVSKAQVKGTLGRSHLYGSGAEIRRSGAGGNGEVAVAYDWGAKQFPVHGLCRGCLQPTSKCMLQKKCMLQWGANSRDRCQEQRSNQQKGRSSGFRTLPLLPNDIQISPQNSSFGSLSDPSQLLVGEVKAELHAPASDELKPGVRVTLFGLQARLELNGLVGVLRQWHSDIGRWEVEVENTQQRVKVRVSNLQYVPDTADVPDITNAPDLPNVPDLHCAPQLPSNEGWCGKTVHCWVFGDQQETISQHVPRRVLTVHPTKSTSSEEETTCTNMAGELVVTVSKPMHDILLGEILAAAAGACSCEPGDVQLLMPDGRAVRGLDHWTLDQCL
eukprot:TRINITY_DN96753_c0_g1_i1.p1 TRINITY_DN96753_c0_g1~~TRINITY_DN96753_c0_g1_i1.p1  ORF type:complete len:354 (-),score=37.21 TRINITY_DN96753_c0_g1_i1:44-1105(-)